MAGRRRNPPGGPTLTPADPDVLVVGAGPTGLTLGLELAAHGLRCRVVDRAADRVHESRALAIQPRTLEVLARDGLARELVARGNPALELRIHLGRRTVPLRLFDDGLEDTAYPFLLFLAQAETERILGERLGLLGAAVERGVELTGLAPGLDAVTCTLRAPDGSEETVRARYVVGCDGSHSTVRRLAGIAFRGAAYAPTFVLADAEVDGLEPGPAHVFVSGRGVLLFFPIGSPAGWRLIAMRPRGDTAEAGAAVELDELQRLVDAFTRGVRLRDPVWSTNFRLYLRHASRYRAGRVLLAGDAAHIHSPAGAQGMNTGIQDAVNLGWKLALVASRRAPDRLLDTYASEREPVGRAVLRLTDRAFTVATSDAAPLRLARSSLAPVLVPAALRLSRRLARPRVLAFRTIAELTISYRRSPLSAEGPGAPGAGPRAGDRLPDAPLDGATPDGETLHDLVAAPGFHVLLCGPPAAWPESAAAALGETATLEGQGLLHVHRLDRGTRGHAVALARLGIREEPAALLVRPDGHLGYRGGPDLAGLRAHLDRYGNLGRLS
jgi:2-polyprenyl-6-methoxyphenol hydroxylase-like FAD-dependent oxidoreductase